MTSTLLLPELSQLSAGTLITEATVPISRATLVRYAAASGDFNPIHWNERFAREVGLPDVIAHGMFSMGAVIAPLTQWLGDPALIIDYRTRFSAPLVVPDPPGSNPEDASVELTVKVGVGAVDSTAGIVRFDITAHVGEEAVLSRTQVKVQWPQK